ncbi:hypothetical protein GIB67_040815 [Kingdonia uniflora]|uniref:Uncharacterized protein n=1 Tax=Kingdonia uniflora TaxID=39325 RepID=A0A7J7P4X5_9MAGN|nr:hypothetical protein GIB67_040815 [Kingdonia uniflora]
MPDLIVDPKSGEEAEMIDKVEPVNLKLAPEAPSALLPLDGNSCATDSDETKSDVGQSSSSSKPDLIVDPKSEKISKVNQPAKLKWNKNARQAYVSENSFITRMITPKDLKKLNDKLAERKDWNPTTDVAYDYTGYNKLTKQELKELFLEQVADSMKK